MKRLLLTPLFIIALITNIHGKSLVDYVNPLIGTAPVTNYSFVDGTVFIGYSCIKSVIHLCYLG